MDVWLSLAGETLWGADGSRCTEFGLGTLPFRLPPDPLFYAIPAESKLQRQVTGGQEDSLIQHEATLGK